jgi:hypothetical protein
VLSLVGLKISRVWFEHEANVDFRPLYWEDEFDVWRLFRATLELRDLVKGRVHLRFQDVGKYHPEEASKIIGYDFTHRDVDHRPLAFRKTYLEDPILIELARQFYVGFYRRVPAGPLPLPIVGRWLFVPDVGLLRLGHANSLNRQGADGSRV